MQAEKSSNEAQIRRRAVERLLAWGFTPRLIAVQTGCSASWVYEVRRERRRQHADTEEAHLHLHVPLTMPDR